MKNKTKHTKEGHLEVKWLDRVWTPEIHGGLFSGKAGEKNSSRAKNAVQNGAFTLVEMLVVIAIIAILAGMILPAISKAKVAAQVATARSDMKAIETAISHYHSTYGRYPMPISSSTDFTFGAVRKDGTFIGTSNPTNNADLMAILLDDDRPDLANSNHVKNPQKIQFLSVAKRGATNTSPGLGPDLCYRDPWGNPFIISIDYNYDNHVRDSFYSTIAVSQQGAGPKDFHGLYEYTAGVPELNTAEGVMIWSFGPDKDADPTLKADPSIKNVNKDNVLSWAER